MSVTTYSEPATAKISNSSRVGRYRWVICALLFFACVINYMDRQILGLLKPDLMPLLGWTEKDYGIIAICFQAAYAAGQVAFGPLMNQFGTKATYACAMTFWSVAAMAHALMTTVFGFGAARVALGLGEAGNFPAAIKTVAEWFPPRERSVATGIFNAGSNVGSIFAPLLVPWLFLSFGWKTAFVAVGACGFVWLVFWLMLFDSPGNSRRLEATELAHINSGVPPTAEASIPWMSLLRYREAWAYYGTCVLVGPVWWFYGFWLPGFFHDHFHLDIKGFGLPLAIIGAVTAIGSILGGALSACFLKMGWPLNRSRKTASLLCACCTLPVILTPRVGNVWVATACFAVAAAAHQGWSATMYSTVADIFPKPAVASVVGFGGTLASLVSLGFFWVVSNILQDQGTYGSIMLVCGSAYVVAWLIFQVGVPQIKAARVG